MKRITILILAVLMATQLSSCKVVGYRSIQTPSKELKQVSLIRDNYRFFFLIPIPTGSDALLCNIDEKGDFECVPTGE
jgi:hypothetical protein